MAGGQPNQGAAEADILCSEACVVNQGIGEARAATLFCRSWQCDICQPRRQKELVALARSGEPNTFITLTSNPATGSSPADRARALVSAWRAVVRAAKARYGYSKIPYLCVFETTKRGEPHLHVLCRVKWIGQDWLSKTMARLTEAPIVDVRRVKSKRQMANYVAKYVGKEPEAFDGCKRYWCTRDYNLDDWQPDRTPGRWSGHWEVRTRTLSQVKQDWLTLGWAVEEQDGFVWGHRSQGRDPPPDARQERVVGGFSALALT